jgi:hypothetical protein
VIRKGTGRSVEGDFEARFSFKVFGATGESSCTQMMCPLTGGCHLRQVLELKILIHLAINSLIL